MSTEDDYMYAEFALTLVNGDRHFFYDLLHKTETNNCSLYQELTFNLRSNADMFTSVYNPNAVVLTQGILKIEFVKWITWEQYDNIIRGDIQYSPLP